jgi:hypothetical protein
MLPVTAIPTSRTIAPAPGREARGVEEEAMFGKSSKLTDSIAALAEPGEQVLAAIAVQPKGSGNAMAVGGLLGSALAGRGGKDAAAAQEATGITLPRWAAMAVTNQRVLILQMNSMGSKATEIVGALPVTAVDGIGVEKTTLRKTVTLSASGATLQMETHKATPAESLQDAFQQARAGV